jgi:DNA-binding NtrC family response regulator
MLTLSDFPQTIGHAAPDSELPHSEPLVVAPSLVSGSDIPIAPLSTGGSLSMLTATGEVRPLEEMENEIIRFAISHYRGQMSEVARRLKIGRSTLYRKLDEAAAGDPAEGGAQDAN